jgi:propanol-preferring alcohol dehydrogenase
VSWLSSTCGHCDYCEKGRENLCDQALFTGFDLPGGFAEYTLAEAKYCLALPLQYDSVHAAPLLCAGLIGYRAYSMAGDGRRLGLYGFGAAAHLMLQIAAAEGKQTFAFVRPGDEKALGFARSMGATWAGFSGDKPPVGLDAALIFASPGELVPQALRQVVKGGRVICVGIYMSDVPSFPYSLLWGERSLQSVANLTREDGLAFMRIAGKLRLQVNVKPYSLAAANQALADLRAGEVQGAAVLVPSPVDSSRLLAPFSFIPPPVDHDQPRAAASAQN